MVASLDFESVRGAGGDVAYHCVGYWGNPNGVRILTGVALFQSSTGERFYCRGGTEVKIDEASLQEEVDEGRFQWLDQPQPAHELIGRVLVCPVPDDLARSRGSALAIRSQVRYLLPDAETGLRASIFAHDAERFSGLWPNDDDDVDAAQTKLREVLVLLDELCAVRPDFFAIHALGAYVAMLAGDALRQQHHVAELRSQLELALRRCSRQLQWPEISEIGDRNSQVSKLLTEWVPTFWIDGQNDAQDYALRIEFRRNPEEDYGIEPNASLSLQTGADALLWHELALGLTEPFFQAGSPLVHTMALLQCVMTGALASKDTLDANARLLLRDFLFVLPAKIKSYRLQIASAEPKKFDYWESPKWAVIDAQLAAAPVIAMLVAQLADVLTRNLDGSASQQLLARVVDARVSRTKTNAQDVETRLRNAVTQIVGCALVEDLYRGDNRVETITKLIAVLNLQRQEWEYLGFEAEVLDVCRRVELLWHQTPFDADWIPKHAEVAQAIWTAMMELGRDDFRKGRFDTALDRFFSAWQVADALVDGLDGYGRYKTDPRDAVLDRAARTACTAAFSGADISLAKRSVELYQRFAKEVRSLDEFQLRCQSIAVRIAGGELVSSVRGDPTIGQIIGGYRVGPDLGGGHMSDISRQVWTLYGQCVLQSLGGAEMVTAERLRSVLAQVWQRAMNVGGIVAMKCAVARLRLLQHLQTGSAASERMALIDEMRIAADAIESSAKNNFIEPDGRWVKTFEAAAEYLSTYRFSLRWRDRSGWVVKARVTNDWHLTLAKNDRVAQMRAGLLGIYEAEFSAVTEAAHNYYLWTDSALRETGVIEAARRYFEGGDACWYRAAEISVGAVAADIRKSAECGFSKAFHLTEPPSTPAAHRYAQCLQLGGKFSDALEVLRHIPTCELRTRVLETQIVCSTFSDFESNSERLGRALERIDEAIAEMLHGPILTSRTQMVRAFKAVGALEKRLRLASSFAPRSFDWKWKKLAPAALKGGAWDGSGLWQLTNWGVRVPGLGEACNASLVGALDSRVGNARLSYYLFSLASAGDMSIHESTKHFDDAVNVGLLSTEAVGDATKRLRDKLNALLPRQDQRHVDNLLASVASCDPKFEARRENASETPGTVDESLSLRGSAFLDRELLTSLMRLHVKPTQAGEVCNSDERVYRYGDGNFTLVHRRIFAPIIDLSGATWDNGLSEFRIENAFAPT